MAEIESGGSNHKRGARPNRKKSTSIDMTAMVDVAFLLLTFFILTTALASPTAMQLTQPEQSEVAVAQSKLMTIILGENDQIHCFTYENGLEAPTIKSTNFSAEGIRAAILSHLSHRPDRCPKNATAEDIKANGCWDPIFVLKAASGSKYKNMVDILDEMEIVDAPKYALAPLDAADSLLMQQHGLR